MDNSQCNGASAPPAEEQVQPVEETVGGGNPLGGNPPGAGAAPTQVQSQMEQNTVQGDATTPIETRTRQRTDAVKLRAAKAKGPARRRWPSKADAAGTGGEARASCEERAVFYATRVTILAGEAFETLKETRWSRRDCTEFQDELDWEMRTFRKICNELDPSSLPAKMRRAAQAREDRVDHEYQRATRVVDRLLRAHEGRPRETGGPAAGGGRRDEREYPDEFASKYAPEEKMEYEESVPKDRRPTLPVVDILGAGRPERSWDSAPGAGCQRPAASNRSRGIGYLGIAGLHIGAPARLQRGRKAAQPGVATPAHRC